MSTRSLARAQRELGSPTVGPASGAPEQETDPTLAAAPTVPRVSGAGRPALWLAGGNLAFNLIGLLTGPILARALGPAGRGTLAAILVPLFIASWAAAIGLPTFARRSAAREGRPQTLAATLAVIAVASSLVFFVAGLALAPTLADGRDVVYDLLVAGLALLPLFVIANILVSVLGGLEQWRYYLAAQLLPPASTLIALIVLWAAGQLTVTTAAVTTLGSVLLVYLPAALVLRGRGAFRFELPLARRAMAFGFKAWPGDLGLLANARLDQLIMIPLVNPADLGFYVVAWTVSTGPTVLGRALAWAVTPTVARGDTAIVFTASRVLVPTVLISTGLIAAVTPVLIPLVFGEDFDKAVGLALILLCASVPYQGRILLGEALSASGRPGLYTGGELIAVAVTVPGLLLLLPSLGVYAAALVSVAAYFTQYAFVLWAARRHFGGSYAELLVLRRADIRTVAAAVSRRRRGGGS